MCLVTWLIWATYNPFPKISERRKIAQKPRDRAKSHAGACFTFYFISYIPKFQKMENTRPHKIRRDRIGYLIKSKLIVFKLIVDRKLKL